MTATAVNKAFIVAVVLLTALGLAVNVAPVDGVAQTARAAIEWGRLIGGVIGTLGVLVGGIMFVLALNKTQAVSALQNTVKIYEGERDALKQSQARALDDLTALQQKAILYEATIAGLKARTDLAEVIKSQQDLARGQQELNRMKEDYNTAMLKMLTDMQKHGTEQYGQAMLFLGDLKKQIAEIHAAVTSQ